MQLLGNYSIFMHVYREVVSKQTFPICTQHNFASYATLPRNDLLSRLYWGTQWTMEIS